MSTFFPYEKFVRLRLGRPQHAVAKAAGITLNTLSGIETGRINPTDDELDRLSRVLGVPAQMLMMPVDIELPVVPVTCKESETAVR